MSLVKKLKDILFEEEEYTEPVKVVEEVKKEEAPKIVKIEPTREEVKEPEAPLTSERELFRSENNFKFPDFDEEEFASSISKSKPKQTSNVLEYERIETREYTEKKKFKPSPIISPVYGILNQDYKADEIVNKKEVSSNIDIEEVRKRAFEPKLDPVESIESIDEPVVTFFDEKETIKYNEEPKREEYKTIDDLLEEAADEISLEDAIEIPKTNNLDAIEEELEKLETEPKIVHKNLDDTLDNDLFELIDSMYDERGEE